jgi:dihydroneopterin aldolase
MNKILVSGIRLYAFHGCLDEEAKIGSDYQVDIEISTDFSKAAITDDLSETIDYVKVNQIVKEEMLRRSKLLEHVAKRIINRFHAEISHSAFYQIKISKLNPPINGDVHSVSVIISEQ